MSFYSNIRRQCYSNFYGRNIRSKRLILFLGFILLIFLFIFIKKNETCWIEKYRSRLFCFVLTSQENLDSRARAVYDTWGQRCGKFLFIVRLNSSNSYTIYDNQNKYLKKNQLPIQYIPTLPDENYSHLSDKIRSTILFLNNYYPNYDWYLKADDDTYIIVENLLRFLISTIKRYPRPLLYGYRFREDYYVSGGGGYVLTNEAIHLFSEYMNDNKIYSFCNLTSEDMMVGTCFKKIFQIIPKKKLKDLIIVGDTIDNQGRERFHPLAFRLHFNGPSNKFKREWIHFRPFHHTLFGYEGISETTISFHYTKPGDMYEIHSLLYDIRLFHQQVCLKHY